MIQHKIKLKILHHNELLWFLEGIKVTHSDAGNKTLAEQLFQIEQAINNDLNIRCHVECESIELDYLS